jgi:hypothetical protein
MEGALRTLWRLLLEVDARRDIGGKSMEDFLFCFYKRLLRCTHLSSGRALAYRLSCVLFGSRAVYAILEYINEGLCMLYELVVGHGAGHLERIKDFYDSAALVAAANSVARSGSLAEWCTGGSWTVLNALIRVSAAYSRY